MSEKKQLNEEQLEKVNGGDYKINSSGNLSDYAQYVNPITKGVQGQDYLFKTKDTYHYDGWFFGTLSNQYKGFGNLYITYDVKIKAYQLYSSGGQVTLTVSDWGTREFDEGYVQMYSK